MNDTCGGFSNFAKKQNPDPVESSGKSKLNSIYYGKECSESWQCDLGERPDTAAAVERLYELAEGRAVLEFGIGTGRLSLPLFRRGLRVAGIEYSQWMAAELASKPDGSNIPVIIGDFTTESFVEKFGLVFLASYTLFALGTQREQVECFRNAEAHLEPGGLFVVELPSIHSGIYENGAAPMSTGFGWYEPVGSGKNVWLLLVQVDKIKQTTRQCYVDIRNDKAPRLRPSDGRYASPDEVDLMALTAGLEPAGRWSSWSTLSYCPETLTYIAAYKKPE